MTSQHLAILSAAVMSPREDFDFREEWEEGSLSVKNPLENKEVILMQIFTQKAFLAFLWLGCQWKCFPHSHSSRFWWMNGLAVDTAQVWACVEISH